MSCSTAEGYTAAQATVQQLRQGGRRSALVKRHEGKQANLGDLDLPTPSRRDWNQHASESITLPIKQMQMGNALTETTSEFFRLKSSADE